MGASSNRIAEKVACSSQCVTLRPCGRQLRADFLVFLAEWDIEVNLDSINNARVVKDLGYEIRGAAKQSQRSRSNGSFGWEGSELWVAEGLRGTFRVRLRRTDVPEHAAQGRVRPMGGAVGGATQGATQRTAQGSTDALAEARAGLEQRGEKLETLASSSQRMANEAESFYNAARRLNGR